MKRDDFYGLWAVLMCAGMLGLWAVGRHEASLADRSGCGVRDDIHLVEDAIAALGEPIVIGPNEYIFGDPNVIVDWTPEPCNDITIYRATEPDWTLEYGPNDNTFAVKGVSCIEDLLRYMVAGMMVGGPSGHDPNQWDHIAGAEFIFDEPNEMPLDDLLVKLEEGRKVLAGIKQRTAKMEGRIQELNAQEAYFAELMETIRFRYDANEPAFCSCTGSRAVISCLVYGCDGKDCTICMECGLKVR